MYLTVERRGETVNTLNVSLGSRQEHRDAVNRYLAAIHRGDAEHDPDAEYDSKLHAGTIADLEDIFATQNLRLIGAVDALEPESIVELATLVDRDLESVHDEITTLSMLGVIEFDSDEPVRGRPDKADTPRVRHDSLVLELDVEKLGDPEYGGVQPG